MIITATGTKTAEITKEQNEIMHTSSGSTNDVNVNVDKANYENWSQKEVLIWLKENLVNNNFDKQIVIGFLKEFSKQYVTGKTLMQFKRNNLLLDQFKTQFSDKNQAFTIWLVVRTAIQNIDQDSQNLNYFD